MDLGVVVFAVIVALFYLRYFQLKRKRKQEEQDIIITHLKKGKKAPPLPPRRPDMPVLRIKSWWLLVPGMVLMLLGLGMKTQTVLAEIWQYWWIPSVIGGGVFIFSFE